MGIRATVKTTIPTPPCHCVRLRQKSRERGSDSTSRKTVAPVVVKPDTVSKKASRALCVAPFIRKGSIPMRERRSQVRVTVSIPSRRVACVFSRASFPRPRSESPTPVKVKIVATQGRKGSPKQIARTSIPTTTPASRRHIIPRTRLINRKLMECITTFSHFRRACSAP